MENLDDLIWYVCYGSNLCYERFMLYIKGGSSEKYGLREGRACKNPNPPIKDKVITIPYKLYFGYHSGTWNHQGVCFINKDIQDITFARAYLITKKQYDDLRNKEGRNLYDLELDLGEIEGIPVKTFTSSRTQDINPPCDRYYKVVYDGLLEIGVRPSEADLYLKDRIHQ